MNNYLEQKNEIQKVFPEKLDFSVSKGKRKDQKRIYARTRRKNNNLFIKLSLNKNDLFYLREREAYKSNAVKQFAPRLIRLLSQGNVFTLIEGQMLDALFSKNFDLYLANQAIEEIAHFHKYSKKGMVLDKDISAILTKNRLNSNKYRVGVMHGDFDPFNIIVSRNRISFIDWEDYRENGLCEIDFVHFITMLWIIINKHHNLTLEDKAKKIVEDVFKLDKFKVLFGKYSSISHTERNRLLELFPAYCDLSVARLKRNKRDWKGFVYLALKKESKKWLRQNMREI